MALLDAYKLNSLETETHLVEFLELFTEEAWVKLNYLPPKEIDKVLLRTFLTAILSRDAEKCKFAWDKVLLFQRERYVLFEGDHLVLKLLLKSSFDANIFTWVITRTYVLIVCDRDLFSIIALGACLDLHGKLFEDRRCSHAKQMNIIWKKASSNVKAKVMYAFKRATKIKLLSMLNEKEMLENPLVTQYFNLNMTYCTLTNTVITSSNIFVLSDTEKEATLAKFIDFFLNAEEGDTLINEWDNCALFYLGGEDLSRAMLRFYLASVTHVVDAKFDFGWQKVIELGIDKYLLEIDDYCVIKVVLDTCNRTMLRRFLVVVSDRLNRRKTKEMLRAAIKHCIHYHNRFYHNTIWDSTISTQMLLKEMKTIKWTEMALEIIGSLELKEKEVLKLLLPSYVVLKDVPMSSVNVSKTYLLPGEHEANLVAFLKLMQQKPELLEKYWTRFGLNNLNPGDAFKAHFRALLIAMFIDDPPNIFDWAWEKLGAKRKDVFLENNYHICVIMTATDCSIFRLLDEARKYLDKSGFINFLRNCFVYIAQQHGKFYSGKVWDGGPALKTLREKCTSIEWELIFARYFP